MHFCVRHTLSARLIFAWTALCLGLMGATGWASAADSTDRSKTDTTDSRDSSSSTSDIDGNDGLVQLKGTPYMSTSPRLTDEDLDRLIKARAPKPYKPGEFELYVNRLVSPVHVDRYLQAAAQPANGDGKQPVVDLPIKRLGADLMLDETGSIRGTDTAREIPPDYRIGIGDELVVTLWGSVAGEIRVAVDRNGRITIPRVGPVLVAGVRYADLSDTISARVAKVFRNFKVSASLGRLRYIRIYVTGYTAQPGAYSVSSLSTVLTGLMRAGGPSAAGSFRNIELRRQGQTVARFDLYALLLQGDQSADRPLQANDVLYVGPVGPQVAVLGSINKPSVLEIKPGETVAEALEMAGGLSTVADRTRVATERLTERLGRRLIEFSLPGDGKQPLENGDVMRVFSNISAVLPQNKQFKHVRVDGEVNRPGEYILPPNATLQDALQAAGGLTADAYVFGTEFTRESVRVTQQENYDRALRDLETEFTRTTSTQRAISADEAAAQQARAAGVTRLIERMRAVRPNGRLVLQMSQKNPSLPVLRIEDGDRLAIPARPNTVSVFGSVFNAGSYLYRDGSSIDDVMRLAGGATRGADTASTFVLRANGSVVSARQESGWFSGNSFAALPAVPGDTVFVPEELDKTTFTQSMKEWTQILYQFGLGAAALQAIRN